jgi:flagellar L-ring protein precursor FlgH
MMDRQLFLWFVVHILLVPAIASGGTIGPLTRQNPTQAWIGDQAQELKQSLSSYRYEGSLWEERRSDFYLDNKARRINDVVTIQISEISNASQQVSTKTSRDTNILASIVKFFGSPLSFGLDNFWGKDKAFAPELQSSAKSSHSGSGAISGSGKLTAHIAAKVIEVMPNGNLVVEGRKEVTVEREKRLIILSGIVRPADIEFDNTISSDKVADARIEYVGKGVISDKQGPGVLHRFFDWIYPL